MYILMFFNFVVHSYGWKPHYQMKPNLAGMVLGSSYFKTVSAVLFLPSKMAALTKNKHVLKIAFTTTFLIGMS